MFWSSSQNQSNSLPNLSKFFKEIYHWYIIKSFRKHYTSVKFFQNLLGWIHCQILWNSFKNQSSWLPNPSILFWESIQFLGKPFRTNFKINQIPVPNPWAINWTSIFFTKSFKIPLDIQSRFLLNSAISFGHQLNSSPNALECIKEVVKLMTRYFKILLGIKSIT